MSSERIDRVLKSKNLKAHANQNGLALATCAKNPCLAFSRICSSCSSSTPSARPPRARAIVFWLVFFFVCIGQPICFKYTKVHWVHVFLVFFLLIPFTWILGFTHMDPFQQQACMSPVDKDGTQVLPKSSGIAPCTVCWQNTKDCNLDKAPFLH